MTWASFKICFIKGLKFTSVPSLFEENLEKSSFNGPSEYTKETARQKALEVYHRLQKVGSFKIGNKPIITVLLILLVTI